MSKFKIGLTVLILASLVSCGSSSVNVTDERMAVAEVVSHNVSTATPAPTAEPSPSVPAIVTYNVDLSPELQDYTSDMCKKYSVDDYYPLMIAVMWKESNFDAKEVSATNDYGIMQINKVNHEWLGETLGTTNFLDAKQSIEAGVYMLSGYLLKYKDIDKALMAYNLGEGGAKKRWAAGTYSTDYTRAVREKLKQVMTSRND